MKSLTLTFLVAVALTLSVLQAQISTPAASPASKIEQAIGLGTVTVEYARPSMKGRTIFGGLVPYDKIWRTGANSGTKVTFSEDVKLAGKEVPAGQYTLYSVPGKSSWKVMVYKNNRLGGNVANYDEKDELTNFMVDVTKLPFKVETMTMMFGNLKDDGADLSLMWEDAMITLPIEVEVDAVVMKNIEKVLAGPSAGDYYQAAVYYYSTGKDLDQALAWMNKAVKDDDQRFWMVTNKARLLGKMGKKAEAIATSKRAMQLAEKAKNSDYVKINKDLIAGWQ